uniref:CCHC-type domain-containing protein n=1 Tax=Cairina moschata TaxID=8855 RepID=A0A8C3CQM2_CAIMO
MERQAAYDLLKCFLEKQSTVNTVNIDCKKELPGLLAYGVAKGCFTDPNTVFEFAEWKKLGDKLIDEVINDSKTAKKLLKPWKAVTNALAIHQAEQKVAAAASERLGPPGRVSNVNSQQANTEGTDYPLPPSVRNFTVSQGVLGSWEVPVTTSSVAEENFPVPVTTPTAPIESDKGANGGADPNLFKSDKNPFSTNPFKINVQEREGLWKQIAEEALHDGSYEEASQLAQTFPVVYFPPDEHGNVRINMTNLDWKLLTQLRSTVNDSGLKGEPTRQILDYIWGTNILLPGDIRSIMKLILTQHQQLLFNAHWHDACQESVAMIRQPGDPLYGVTLDELMGVGPYFRLEAQALLGPDKAKESMQLARKALDRIKEPGGIPSYMGIKQGKDEPFGLFIDRVANAIQAAGVPDYLKGTILKQCAIQNSNPSTPSILATLPGTWTIEEGLERMSQVPVGLQAMLVEAVKQLGDSMKEQAQALRENVQQNQKQVLAALAPLRTPGSRFNGRESASPQRCFRCGVMGHIRRECKAEKVWCQKCRCDTHDTGVCNCKFSGNGRSSGRGRPATTQKAASTTAAGAAPAPTAATNPFTTSNQPPEGALDWIWQLQ